MVDTSYTNTMFDTFAVMGRLRAGVTSQPYSSMGRMMLHICARVARLTPRVVTRDTKSLSFPNHADGRRCDRPFQIVKNSSLKSHEG